MLDYTAIDFETANSYRGSPCSVGLVRVRDGQAVESRHWLIRPPEGADWFDPWNTAVHGITAEMVADSPRWRDVLPHIVSFIGDDVVVAHNAGFDTGVIRYACALDNIEWPQVDFLCTLVLARRALALPTYRLPFVAESLGYLMEDHHNALSDANAVVEIVARLAAKEGATDLVDLAGSVGVRVGRMGGGVYTGSVSVGGGIGQGGKNFTPIEVNPNADPDGYLYGRVVVFTGTLMSMTRDVARQECAKVGAVPENDTTKRTNVLVVGDLNPGVLRPGSNLTGKTRKAFQLQDAGQQIEVMTEDDFLRCLGGNKIDGEDILLNIESVHPGAGHETSRSLRRVPLAERSTDGPAEPNVIKPPRPLRRTPVPTDQICAVEGCGETAAFKTRSKPTWCAGHIQEMQREGGLIPLETFTHPEDFQLAECVTCTIQAHYRFAYTLEKNGYGEATCRACYWRDWAVETRRLQAAWSTPTPVPYDEAKSHAEQNGFEYLGPLTAPSFQEDPHHTKCRRCGKISVDRLSDIGFGCRCQPRS